MKLYWKTQWHELKKEIRKDNFLYLFVLFLVITLFILSSWIEQEITFKQKVSNYFQTLFFVCFITFLSWSTYFYLKLLFNLTPHPLVKFAKTIFSFFSSLSQGGTFIFLLLAMNLVFSSYSYLKTIIPALHPFQYDLMLYQLDKSLHFGISPWQLTHSVFSTPLASLMLNFFYHLWFLLMWGITSYFMLIKHNLHLRNQYLISFMLCWLIIGALFATLLSSAGPCYIHLINPDATQYLPLLERLNAQNSELLNSGFPPLWALNVQENLWGDYISRDRLAIGSGISAMPSMHVSMAVLMALVAYQLNKKLGIALWIFAIFIEIGSVHLAWHYALDGYVSALLTIGIWYLVDFTIRRLERLQRIQSS